MELRTSRWILIENTNRPSVSHFRIHFQQTTQKPEVTQFTALKYRYFGVNFRSLEEEKIHFRGACEKERKDTLQRLDKNLWITAHVFRPLSKTKSAK